jgi:hypothetical protein
MVASRQSCAPALTTCEAKVILARLARIRIVVFEQSAKILWKVGRPLAVGQRKT